MYSIDRVKEWNALPKFKFSHEQQRARFVSIQNELLDLTFDTIIQDNNERIEFLLWQINEIVNNKLQGA